MFEILITSSILIVALALIRRVWKGRLSPVFTYALWLMAAVRLLVPIPLFGNAFSVMNLVNDVVWGAEEWIENREEENRAKDDAFTYRTDLKAGEAAVSVEAEAAEIAGVSQERQQSGINGEASGAKRNQFNADSESFRESGGIGNASLPPQRQETAFSVVHFIRFFWYAGIAVMAAGMLIFNGMFLHRLCQERRLLCRRGRVRVYVAENLDSPCLYGLFRPAVYLTPDCLLTERCREHAIAHELTHYRHGDHIWVLARSLCVILYWFDPFVWMAAYLSSKDCELACDAGTIRRLGEGQRQAYGCTLIEMAWASAGRMRILCCATDLSCGKKELKERIAMIAGGKKKMGMKAVLPVLCAVLLAACTFGGAREEAEKGGYAESIVELPAELEGAAIAQDGDTIRLIDPYGTDLLSVDGGNVFEIAEPISHAQRARSSADITGLAGTVDGTRICNIIALGKVTWKLVTGEDEEIILEGSGEDNFYPISAYGEGCFYSFNGNQIYKTDAVTGDTNLFIETNYPIVFLAAGEHILYAVTIDGFQLYDLDSGERLAKQDELLGGYLSGMALEFSGFSFPVILYPSGEEIYVLTHDGVYRHTLYGDTMELVLDSGIFGSIGNPDRDFAGMAVIKGEGEGKDTFLILYSDGSLVRYAFDPELSSEPDLRVYSVYEDVNVIRAVNAYREAHPERTVVYEVGNKSNYGVALMDILNNLSTEIAAGTGPDILVMDAIPYQSYADKGVLMDLSFLRDTMAEDAYYTSVVDGFAAEEGIFAMPMAFVVPVIGTNPKWIGQLRAAESLSDLADILEETRKEIPEGDLVGFFQAEHTLSQLSQASMGAWMNEEGGVDRTAVTEFLTQAKRIYDAAMKGAPEGMENWYVDWPETLDANMITRTFGEDLNRTLEFSREEFILHGHPDPFYTDYLRENYARINGYLELFEGELTLLPGQKYGSCLPVTVMAVNQGTKHAQESREFMEFVFSGEAQGSMELFGFPVSREAYKLKQIDTRPEGWRGAVGSIWFDARANDRYDYYWPSEEAFQRLDDLLDQVTGVGICDSQVYNTVLRLGQAALKGESGIEETVDAIEKELRIYLAE